MDSGYQGAQHHHENTVLPIKRKKGQTLASEDKKMNQQLSSERVLNEHIIGRLKRFKIILCRYRYRRKRFAVQFNSWNSQF